MPGNSDTAVPAAVADGPACVSIATGTAWFAIFSCDNRVEITLGFVASVTRKEQGYPIYFSRLQVCKAARPGKGMEPLGLKWRIVFCGCGGGEMRNNQTVLVATMIAATALMSGCRIESDKHGDNDNVKIATPFGGMTVKTNDAAVDGLGLPVYPGADLVKKDKNNGAADVNMSFGSFQLRVKAASYRTPDSPDQVTAFYRKSLGRYGDVIQCQNDKPVGSPARTAEGLTCDNNKDNHVYVNDDESGKLELKAGSKQHQHIVAIDPEGNGTKFGLVALDLPGHFGDKDDKQSQ
jgi:hypothetical protein